MLLGWIRFVFRCIILYVDACHFKRGDYKSGALCNVKQPVSAPETVHFTRQLFKLSH